MSSPRTSCRWASHRRRGCSLRAAAPPGVRAQPVAGHRANGAAAAPGASTGAGETRTTTWANSTRACCWTRCFSSILASQVNHDFQTMMVFRKEGRRAKSRMKGTIERGRLRVTFPEESNSARKIFHSCSALNQHL